ncbi:MAG: host attachment protein [Micavibrio sp.]
MVFRAVFWTFAEKNSLFGEVFADTERQKKPEQRRTMKMTKNNDVSPIPHKKPVIWILVADKHVARLFRKNGHGIEPFAEIKPVPHEKKDITNKSVGRAVSSSSGTIHHKYEPHMNESRKDALSFVQEITDWLHEPARDNAFDRLVLVAAPQMLGELRKILSKPVQARIVAEVDKDLTKMSEKDLQAELEKILWF